MADEVRYYVVQKEVEVEVTATSPEDALAKATELIDRKSFLVKVINVWVRAE